jgi:Fur family zinc uptake transcriptional regulator
MNRLAAAAGLCREAGARFTADRRRVLALLLRSQKPLSAYQLLARLRREKSNAAPVTVYRALSFLRGLGLAHRLPRRGGYVACARPGRRHAAQFFHCDKCAFVVEVPTAAARFDAAAKKMRFAMADATVEINGLCARCAAH